MSNKVIFSFVASGSSLRIKTHNEVVKKVLVDYIVSILKCCVIRLKSINHLSIFVMTSMTLPL